MRNYTRTRQCERIKLMQQQQHLQQSHLHVQQCQTSANYYPCICDRTPLMSLPTTIRGQNAPHFQAYTQTNEILFKLYSKINMCAIV